MNPFKTGEKKKLRKEIQEINVKNLTLEEEVEKLQKQLLDKNALMIEQHEKNETLISTKDLTITDLQQKNVQLDMNNQFKERRVEELEAKIADLNSCYEIEKQEKYNAVLEIKALKRTIEYLERDLSIKGNHAKQLLKPSIIISENDKNYVSHLKLNFQPDATIIELKSQLIDMLDSLE